MGTTSWPCPHCGQQQKVEHPNSEAVFPHLCAACAEACDDEIQALRDQGDAHFRERSSRKAAAEIFRKYGRSEEDAQRIAEALKPQGAGS